MRVPDSVNKRTHNLFSFHRHIHVQLLLRIYKFGNLLCVTTCSYIYYVIADFGVISYINVIYVMSVFCLCVCVCV